ncbi:hypothetical protein OUZ56_014762 [Daphnia magna]|uniref:Uncharacterized protein n=1 Tax=Daphnia magna TaxID=35525 RepID=A0ABR0AKR6_9CRUS|nr:hypothetical protein OUZ56_014762 [Daphnia magna]
MKHQRDCHPSLTKETSTVGMNSVPDLPQFLQEQDPSKAYNRPASNAEEQIWLISNITIDLEYLFLVYNQPGPLNCDEPPISNSISILLDYPNYLDKLLAIDSISSFYIPALGGILCRVTEQIQQNRRLLKVNDRFAAIAVYILGAMRGRGVRFSLQSREKLVIHNCAVDEGFKGFFKVKSVLPVFTLFHHLDLYRIFLRGADPLSPINFCPGF